MALAAAGTEIWRLAYWQGRKSAPSRGADVMLQLPFWFSSRSPSAFAAPNFDLVAVPGSWQAWRTEGRASGSGSVRLVGIRDKDSREMACLARKGVVSRPACQRLAYAPGQGTCNGACDPISSLLPPSLRIRIYDQIY